MPYKANYSASLCIYISQMDSVGVTKIDARDSDCSRFSDELGAVQCQVERVRVCPHINESISPNKIALGLNALQEISPEERTKWRQNRYIVPAVPVSYNQWWNYTILLCSYWSVSHSPSLLLVVVTINQQPTHRDQARDGSQWQCWRYYAFSPDSQWPADRNNTC